jgi:hypothetical protein
LSLRRSPRRTLGTPASAPRCHPGYPAEGWVVHLECKSILDTSNISLMQRLLTQGYSLAHDAAILLCFSSTCQSFIARNDRKIGGETA